MPPPRHCSTMPRAADPGTVQRADPSARRRAMIFVIVIATTGGGALFALQRWLTGLSAAEYPAGAVGSLVSALWFTSISAAIGLVAFGAHAWRQAGRVEAAQRFPRPGQLVIRDTVVLEGSAALRRGKLLRVVAILLAVAGVFLVVLIRLLVVSLSQRAG